MSPRDKTPFEQVVDLIDELCDPADMTRNEYNAFLEDLETEIAGRIESEDEFDDELDDDDGLEEP